MSSFKDEFLKEYNIQLQNIEDMPQRLNEAYKIEACLMDEAEKQTFLVSSKSDARLYIIKRALQKSAELSNEYAALSALHNVTFPKAIDYFEEGLYAYLIREYVEGTNLYQTIETEGLFSQQRAVETLIALCSSLSYMHHQKPPLIHRDIKPQNIILTPEGRPVLIDMGTSRRYKEDAASDTIFMGTHATAAPEQYGFSQTDARCDIYAMGILLVFLLTGGFSADKNILMTISRPLRRIISKCIMFDPKRRYANVNILRLHLERCLTRRKRLMRASLFAAAGIVLFFAGALAGWSFGASAGHTALSVTNAAAERSHNSESLISTAAETPQRSQASNVTPVQTEGIDDEISEAVGYGIVPGDIQGNWNDTITNRQYCTMIGNMLALKDFSYADQWKTTAALALDSDLKMKRQEGMLALFYGAKILGQTDSSGNWARLHKRIGEDCWNELSWDYPLFPDWINKAYFAGQFWNDHMTAAYFFGMDARIETSDKRIFDYDKTSNSMLLGDPLTRRDAIHSVLRLYESTF